MRKSGTTLVERGFSLPGQRDAVPAHPRYGARRSRALSFCRLEGASGRMETGLLPIPGECEVRRPMPKVGRSFQNRGGRPPHLGVGIEMDGRNMGAAHTEAAKPTRSRRSTSRAQGQPAAGRALLAGTYRTAGGSRAVPLTSFGEVAFRESRIAFGVAVGHLSAQVHNMVAKWASLLEKRGFSQEERDLLAGP